MGSPTCPTCGGRTIFTTRPCGGDEWNEYYRGADCRDPFHPWNEGPDVGDDDPACTCRPLGKSSCIKHATPTPPAPAADARPMVTGGGLIKFDRILDHAAGGAGDAGVMRERAASILDEYAKNAATLSKTPPEEGYEDRREEWAGTASMLRALATQMRRLPLPARREEAVVEARRAHIDVTCDPMTGRVLDVVSLGECLDDVEIASKCEITPVRASMILRDLQTRGLIAALRGAKGGDK